MTCKSFIITIFILTLSSILIYSRLTPQTQSPFQPTPSPQPVPNLSQFKLTPKQLKAMLANKDFVLINVHIPYAGEIPGTDFNIPYNDINTFKQKFKPNQKIVIYCRSGAMSDFTFQKLKQAGFQQVYDLSGGMIAWQNAGYQLISKNQQN